MCTCTIVYVDTSHENASVVGCYHELKRERKKKNNEYRRRIYSTEAQREFFVLRLKTATE